MGELVPDWLTRRAAGSSDVVAVVAGEERWTYAELHKRAYGAALRLRELGIGTGDRVAVLLNNGPHFVLLVHALIRVGAILVPINTRLTAAEIAWQVNDVRAKLFIYDARNATVVEEIRAALPGVARRQVREIAEGEEGITGDAPVQIVLSGEAVVGRSARRTTPAEGMIDLARTLCIMYTSGTTGKPKGVILTYGNFWWGATGSAFNLGMHLDDAWLAVLPLFHVGGLAILLRSVIYGTTAIIHERFDPVAVNRAIDEEGVSIVSVVATMLQRMLDARGDVPYPPSLRCLLLGGGPAPLPMLERCARIAAPVVQSYGMTETASQAATLAPADALRKIGSAGKPLLHLDLRIEHEGKILPPGEVGEIVVRGGSITTGYADRPDATAKAIRDGWLHTGDLGLLDAEGYLYVMDRRDDLIISGGENVYPAEVEAVLLAHPAVIEAGVVGLPDETWGQSVGAALVLRPGADVTAQVIIEYARTRLARYKVPAQIVFRDSLPRNAGGKLVRRTLREEWPGA